MLAQAPVKLTRLSLSDDATPSNRLQRGLDFVSKRIKELRMRAGLTQIELAEKAGLPQSHISRLESGKHSPSRVTLEKIAAALDVPVSEFDPSA
jgi:DNA-binding XRE family transcriptional regulator